MTSIANIEANLLSFATGFAGRLPQQDIQNAINLISSREWGVGLEVLCAQLAEYEIALDSNEVGELKHLASAMSLDVSMFGLTKPAR
jgi:hypothetical protein